MSMIYEGIIYFLSSKCLNVKEIKYKRRMEFKTSNFFMSDYVEEVGDKRWTE